MYQLLEKWVAHEEERAHVHAFPKDAFTPGK